MRLLLLSVLCLMVTGCPWRMPWSKPRPAPTPVELAGPPAPAATSVKNDPIPGLLNWLSWISVAGMAASVAAGIFLSFFRSIAVQAFLACAGVLVLARTLGVTLPWLPWLGLAGAALWLGWYLINRYRKVSTAAIEHGVEADQFILENASAELIAKWKATKETVSGALQDKLGVRGHVRAIRDRVKIKKAKKE